MVWWGGGFGGWTRELKTDSTTCTSETSRVRWTGFLGQSHLMLSRLQFPHLWAKKNESKNKWYPSHSQYQDGLILCLEDLPFLGKSSIQEGRCFIVFLFPLIKLSWVGDEKFLKDGLLPLLSAVSRRERPVPQEMCLPEAYLLWSNPEN